MHQLCPHRPLVATSQARGLASAHVPASDVLSLPYRKNINEVLGQAYSGSLFNRPFLVYLACCWVWCAGKYQPFVTWDRSIGKQRFNRKQRIKTTGSVSREYFTLFLVGLSGVKLKENVIIPSRQQLLVLSQHGGITRTEGSPTLAASGQLLQYANAGGAPAAPVQVEAVLRRIVGH